jgi:hypothetical protein
MPAGTATRARRAGTVVGWAASNLALGYLATAPLITAVVLSYYIRARVWGTVAAPYHGAEAEASVAVIVVLGTVLAAVTVAANRALRRQPGLATWPAAGFWLATIAVQLIPFAWFMLATDRTIPALLGRGLLW